MSKCMYCEQDKNLIGLMEKVGELTVTTLYLLRDQSFYGRCVLAFDDHIKEVDEMSKEQRFYFIRDLSVAVAAIRRTTYADKINYAIFGDEVNHLHIHLVPKLKDGLLWGKPFCAEKIEPKNLDVQIWNKLIAEIKINLAEIGEVDDESI